MDTTDPPGRATLPVGDHFPEVCDFMPMNFNSQAILEQAVRAGIAPGQCPVCKVGLVPSRRVPVAKVPNMAPNAISFDCPNSQEHIEALDLQVYLISGR
jgi:hypothetical protein